MISRRFILFIAAGGIAAGANFGSRILLSHWLNFVPAIILAYCVGMVTAFLLNRLFVFGNASNSLRNQIGWFIIVNLIAVAQTLVISLALVDYILPAMHVVSYRETIAHGVGVAIPAFTSYLGHKHLSFKTSRSFKN